MDKIDRGSASIGKIAPYNHVSVILPDVDRVWFGTYFYGFGGGGIDKSIASPTTPPYTSRAWRVSIIS